MKNIMFSLILFFLSQNVNAQYLSFSSQLDNMSIFLNPANTGLLKNEKWELVSNYRSQWASVNNMPYQKLNLLFHKKLEINEKTYFGLGFSMNQARFNIPNIYNSIYPSCLGNPTTIKNNWQINGAVHKVIYSAKLTQTFSLGLNYIYSNMKNLDYSKRTYNYFDYSLGINYGLRSEKNNLDLGISIIENNSPNYSHIVQVIQTSYNKLRTYNFTLNYTYLINENWSISTNNLYHQKGPSTELLLGMLVNKNLKQTKKLAFGSYYRVAEAIVPYAGIELNRFKLGLSYDISLSAFTAARAGKGAWEMTLAFKGKRKS